jgi:predicted peptidase
MRSIRGIVLVALGTLGAAGVVYCGGISDLFQERSMTVGGVAHKYRVFVPPEWNRKKSWPVVLYLHGAGERGDDGVLPTKVGFGPALVRDPASCPAVVVFPQCPKNRWWPEPEIQAIAVAALDAALEEFNGDSGRVYLTGISMGGYGTWAVAASNPGRFAALAPVCGGVRPPRGLPNPPGDAQVSESSEPYADVARRIGKVAVWVFHGGADPIVPVSESRKMVEALTTAGNPPRYTEYEGVGHNSWDRAYAEPGFLSWLLSNRESTKTK